jgi:hypothetical protein
MGVVAAITFLWPNRPNPAMPCDFYKILLTVTVRKNSENTKFSLFPVDAWCLLNAPIL